MTAVLEREPDLKITFYQQKGIDRCIEWLRAGVDVYFFLNALLRDQ